MVENSPTYLRDLVKLRAALRELTLTILENPDIIKVIAPNLESLKPPKT